MRSLLLALLCAVAATMASCSSDGLRCGPGTLEQAGLCVVAAPVGDAGEAGAAQESSAGAAGESAAGGAAGESPLGQGGAPDETTLISEPLSCGSRDISNARVITGTITQSATWSGVIYLPEGLTVQNEPTITILPGSKVIVGDGATIEFGIKGSHPKLLALGTALSPVKFCGESDAAGSWEGLVLRSGVQADSALRNVLVTDAGANDAAVVSEVAISMRGLQIRNSALKGLKTPGFSDDSSTLIITGSGDAPLQATSSSAVNVPPDSVLTGNEIDAVDLAFLAFDADAKFRDIGIPYQQTGDMDSSKVKTHPLVTFEPGVVYQIRHNRVLDFGAATVHLLGSSGKPIVFEGLPCAQDVSTCMILPSTNDRAVGGRLLLDGGTDIRLQYVELRSLGWTQSQTTFYIPYGALTITTDALLHAQHIKLTRAAGWGIQLAGSGSFSEDSGALDIHVLPHFSTFTPDALRLACGFMMTIPADTKVSGEPRTNVACFGSALTGSWPAKAGEYVLNGFTVESGGSLTLEPGTVARFKLGSTLKVQSGGTLKVQGTTTDKVRLTRDTTAYSTIGNWNGLVLESGSSALLDYAVVDMAGVAAGANITALQPFALTHSTISNSGAWGIAKQTSDLTDYLTGNTFTANKLGDVTDLPAP